MPNIFGATIVRVVLQRFAANPAIASALACLDDAPRNENGNLREEVPLDTEWRAVRGMVYTEGVRRRGVEVPWRAC